MKTNSQPGRPSPDPTLALTLSARECQVLEGIAHGHTCRQIGVRLGISPRTVESHLTHSLDKLGVRSRAQAVVRGLQLGLIQYVTKSGRNTDNLSAPTHDPSTDAATTVPLEATLSQ